MASSSKLLVPNKFRLHAAQQIVESITERANTAYYLYVGDHTDHSDSALTMPADTVTDTSIELYRNMVMGKRVTANDVTLVIQNNPYTSNTVYAMYDDLVAINQDADTSELPYCVVNATSFFHVFKCLDNNMGARSTVEPDFAHISGANSEVYQTSDGYRWKYMYSVSASQNGKFATSVYFPIVANTTVSDSAVAGAIDIIKVETTGVGYHNYFNGTFSTEDLRIDGNNLVYAVVNSIASSINGFYTDCLIYLSSGTGSGQYKTIETYYANSSGKYIVVNSAFVSSLAGGTQFQITPRVNVIGDGLQTVNAVARALVNSSSGNSIYRIEMLERGARYSYATANVIANSAVAVAVDAEIRPIYSVPGGHGSDPASELGANKVMISVKLQNTESNTILSSNKFQQIGLLKNPMFANVSFELANLVGTFTTGERLYKTTPNRFNRLAVINTTSTQIQCDTGDFINQVAANCRIIIKTAENDQYQLATVNSVTNTTVMTITTNGAFACSQAQICYANISSTCYLSDVVDGTHILTTNVSGVFSTNDMIIGVISGATATVNAIARNNVIKGFDTFIQLHKYEGTVLSGSFVENEQVNQTNSTALLHSAINDGGTWRFYTSNQVGEYQIIDTVNTFVGQTSGAVAQLGAKYAPEIVFGSGDVIMVENIEPKTRQNTQTETFQIILDF